MLFDATGNGEGQTQNVTTPENIISLYSILVSCNYFHCLVYLYYFSSHFTRQGPTYLIESLFAYFCSPRGKKCQMEKISMPNLSEQNFSSMVCLVLSSKSTAPLQTLN